MATDLQQNSDVADRDELLILLSVAARKGSVGAMKALLDELRRDADESDASTDSFAAFDGDELATRRKQA